MCEEEPVWLFEETPMLELTTAQKIVLAVAIAVLGGSSVYLFSARNTVRVRAAEQLYQPPAEGEDAAQVMVHVAGAVNRPGIYRVEPGTRVYEVIELAGGFAAEADTEAANLAALVADGDKVTVPYKPEPEPLPTPTLQPPPQPQPVTRPVQPSAHPQPIKPAAPAPLLVDLNTATQANLERVPGIGPVLAQRIIAYRQRYGPFKTVYQLQLIQGIGQHTFDKIKPYVTVRPPQPHNP